MLRFLVITLQLLFLMLGPVGYAYVVYARWCTGYRTENWNTYEGQAMLMVELELLWLALVFCIISFIACTIQHEPKHRTSRFMIMILAIVLLVGIPTAYIKGLGSGAFDEGRKAMQAEIDLRQLAEDCRVLSKTKFNNGSTLLMREELDSVISFSPTIQRLRPTSISKYKDEVSLKFHGGFDHYGYRLVKDVNTETWNLEWYTDNSSEKLLSIPEPVK